MNPKQKALAAALLLAGGAASVWAILAAGGTVPDATGNRCSVVTALAPCELADALSDAPETCAPGSMAYREVEQRLEDDAGSPSQALPPGLVALAGTEREVACALLRRPSKRITSRRADDPSCVVGQWRLTDGGQWNGNRDSSKCCQPGCSCKPGGKCARVPRFVLAGRDDTYARLCEVLPAHPSCDGGSP